MAALWEWLGEPLGIDLANTVRRRGWTLHELVPDEPALRGWLRALPTALPDPGPLGEADVAAFRDLRDHTLAVLHAVVTDRPLPAASVEAVNAAIVAAPSVSLLRPSGEVEESALAVAEPFDRLLAVLAAAVRDVVVGPDRDLLTFCDAPGCGQFFLRHHPAQTWCDPSCGNRARVARHAHPA